MAIRAGEGSALVHVTRVSLSGRGLLAEMIRYALRLVRLRAWSLDVLSGRPGISLGGMARPALLAGRVPPVLLSGRARPILLHARPRPLPLPQGRIWARLTGAVRRVRLCGWARLPALPGRPRPSALPRSSPRLALLGRVRPLGMLLAVLGLLSGCAAGSGKARTDAPENGTEVVVSRPGPSAGSPGTRTGDEDGAAARAAASSTATVVAHPTSPEDSVAPATPVAPDGVTASPAGSTLPILLPLQLPGPTAPGEVESLPEEELSDLLVRDPSEAVDFQPVLAWGEQQHLVAWSQCDRRTCQAYIALLSGLPKRLAVRQRASLPAPVKKVWSVDGFELEGVSLLDVDGDGRKEALVPYAVQEPPRLATGTLLYRWLAIYNLPELTLAWSHELERTGSSVDEHCTWQVRRQLGDAGTGPPALIVTGRCQRPECEGQGPLPADCRAPRELSETYRWQRSTDRFVLAQPAGGDARPAGGAAGHR